MYPGDVSEQPRELIEQQRAAVEQRIAQAADVSVQRTAETAVVRRVEETVTVTRVEETAIVSRVEEAAELQKQLERGVSEQECLAAATRLDKTEDFQVEAAVERRIVGNPERDKQYFHWQKRGDSCAIVAQEGVLQKHTGIDFGEETLAKEAREHGWYDGGTAPDDVGKLLELHGAPVQRWENGADLKTLKDQVSQGHDVIVSVSARDLWNDPSIPQRAGHALWVTGVETDANGNVTGIRTNDSGRSDGAGIRYDVETFQRAWSRFNNHMVATV